MWPVSFAIFGLVERDSPSRGPLQLVFVSILFPLSLQESGQLNYLTADNEMGLCRGLNYFFSTLMIEKWVTFGVSAVADTL